MRTTLLPLIALVLAVQVFSGCGPRDSEAERSSESPDLVDAQKYLRNAPPGSMIHMPLSGAVAQYYEGNGRLPANFDELVKAGFIKAVPQPPDGQRFFLDPTSMQVLVLPR
jgi:hypothetical protein